MNEKLFYFFKSLNNSLLDIRTNTNITVLSIITPSIWNNHRFIIQRDFLKSHKHYKTKQKKYIFEEFLLLEKLFFHNSYSIHDFFVFIDNQKICSFGELLHYIYSNIKTKSKHKSLYNLLFLSKENTDLEAPNFINNQLQELETFLDSLSEEELKQMESELQKIDDELK